MERTPDGRGTGIERPSGRAVLGPLVFLALLALPLDLDAKQPALGALDRTTLAI